MTNYYYISTFLLASSSRSLHLIQNLIFVIILVGFAYFVHRRTHRIRAHHRLLAELERQFFDVSLNSIPDIVYVKDINMRYVRVNNALCKHHGLTPSDFIGKTSEEVFGDANIFRSNTSEKDNAVLSSLNLIQYSEIIPDSVNMNHIFEITKTPLLTEGKILGILTIARDMTYFKKIEDDLREASHIKSQFLAQMSHEIRTPLNSIIGFSDLASTSTDTLKKAEYLENIKENGTLLSEIINSILDLSKVESGNIEIEHIPFDLDTVFRRSLNIVLPKIKEKGLSFHSEIDERITGTLSGDPTKLIQVIINLLNNAAKFTEFGSVTLSAKLLDNKDGKMSVVINCIDTGIGISPENIVRIYTPFMQADETISRKYGGTGLGLPISKKIIELMGGRIEIESLVGVGSRFSLYLTFEILNDTIVSATRSSMYKPIFYGANILLCEDNIMNQQVMMDHLSALSIDTTLAVDGKQGLEIAKSTYEHNQRFDLILMDINMPIMDGLTATEEMLKLGISTPIIAVTANVMLEDSIIYKNIGMKDHLPKPFQKESLWDLLCTYMTPTSYELITSARSEADHEHNEELLQKLRKEFIKTYTSLRSQIEEAYEQKNFHTLQILSHNLKSNAAQLGEMKLRDLAKKVEHAIASGKAVTPETLHELSNEVTHVIAAFSHKIDKQLTSETNIQTVSEEELLLLLKNSNISVLEVLDSFKDKDYLAEVIALAEDFEFGLAYDKLLQIMKGNENND